MATPIVEGDQWIRQYGRNLPAGAARLVCFPHAGGSASYFFSWADPLAAKAEVLAVQYPGRQDRRLEKCIDSIPELAEHVHRALKPWLTRRYVFFGHSMGTLVAFEVARRVQREGGLMPKRIFASGRRAPSRHRPGDVHRRDDDGVVAELRRVGGTDRRILQDKELLAVILPMVRADYRAVETYAYSGGPPLTCGITALVGEGDPTTTVAEAAAWADHCIGGFALRVFPGDHFYLDAHRPAVFELISAALREELGD